MIVGFMIIACAGACFLAVKINQCNQMNQIPVVEVYPDSTISEQSILDFGVERTATIHYRANATVDDLLAYFGEDLDCKTNEANLATRCQSDLPNGDGTYFVYISATDNRDSMPTSYVVEIHWRGCEWNLQMTG